MRKITFLFAMLLAAGLSSSKAQDTWAQKANFSGGARQSAAGFSIGSKGYIGTGYDNTLKNDFWEFDPVTNVWTQKANFGGGVRDFAVAFSFGNKGYMGTGFDGVNNRKDFWEYDPAGNIWTQKANFGGTSRYGAVGFSIGSNGYIGTGFDSSNVFKNDFWRYNPTTNTWTQKASFGGAIRYLAAGFSIGSKGYIGTGLGTNYYDDFWEYNPATNTWTQKAVFPGSVRYGAVGFSIATRGYLGTGYTNTYNFDLWEYDPATNTWVQRGNLPGTTREYSVGISIGAKGYIGTGFNNLGFQNDFWEYTPVCFYAAAPGKPASVSGSTTDVCGGSAFNYSCPTVANATSYNWVVPAGATINSGQGTTGINVTMPAGFTNGMISVNASNCFGTSGNRSLNVYGIPKKPAAITGSISVCANQANVSYSIVSVIGASSYHWTVPMGASITSGQGTTAIMVNYGTSAGMVKVRSSSNCGSSAYKSLNVSMPCREGENAMEIVSINPNPSSEDFQLQINSANTDLISMMVKDVSGRTIEQFQHLTSNTLTFGRELPAGIYIIEVNLNSEKKVMKVVKE